MKYLTLFVAIFICVQTKGNCQSKRLDTKISYLGLKDPILTENIKNLISREVNADTSKNNLFRKGLGYIYLEIKQHVNSDTVRQYYISPQLLSIKEDAADELYPDFYSYINNRLVVIRLQGLDGFTYRNLNSKTKRDFRKLVDRYLEKTQKRTFYDMNNKKVFTDKNYRLEHFKFHAGIYIYIFNNGSAILEDEK